jgi:hypothetical protein
MHLVVHFKLAVSSTQGGSTTWFGLDPAVVVAIAVGIIGGSGLIWKLVDLWRSRPRFKFDAPPTIDQQGRVRVVVLQKGTVKGYVRYLDVVSVRSTIYRILHRLLASPTKLGGGISVLPKPLVQNGAIPVESNEPREFNGQVEQMTLLAVPWKPWKPLHDRAPDFKELRVKAKWSDKPANYRRLTYKPDVRKSTGG